jgi:hypothetical protein
MYRAAHRQVIVTPAKAGVQGNCFSNSALDARFRGHDEKAGSMYAKLCNDVVGRRAGALVQVASADLHVTVVSQLALAELTLGDALEPGSL